MFNELGERVSIVRSSWNLTGIIFLWIGTILERVAEKIRKKFWLRVNKNYPDIHTTDDVYTTGECKYLCDMV